MTAQCLCQHHKNVTTTPVEAVYDYIGQQTGKDDEESPFSVIIEADGITTIMDVGVVVLGCVPFVFQLHHNNNKRK